MRSPHIRFVRVNGQRTSITLEAEFWEQFRLIVLEYGTSISAMLAEIDRTMRLMPKQRPGRHRVLSLSAAVRIFVLKDVMARSSEDAQASRDRASPWAGEKVLVNTASHRPKCEWIRKNPRLTILLVNPKNPYHWVQIKCTVEKELREWEPGGEYVTKQLDRIWHKYTGQSGNYGLRDPKIDEKRVLFVCGIDRIATFGEP